MLTAKPVGIGGQTVNIARSDYSLLANYKRLNDRHVLLG
jgi:hypothetical protein